MPDIQSSLHVEVIYALPGDTHVMSLQVTAACTIRQAIHQSGILARCSEIDLEKNKVGIFNQIHDLDDLVKEGDRIEIYRPLLVEPKEARRRRAEKQRVKSN